MVSRSLLILLLTAHCALSSTSEAGLPGIEAGPGPQGQGVVVRLVAHGQAGQHRHPQGFQGGREDLQPALVGAAVGEGPQDHTLDPRQHPGQQQVVDHAVQAVEGLAVVLQEEEIARQLWGKGGPHQVAQGGEIAAGQRAFGLARDEDG